METSASSSSAGHRPPETDRNKKYDRQIRLWGEHGQSALETAQVLLINATCVGTEILKGLILPGICSFNIIDNAIVTEEDIGSNFFLTPESIGQSRAKCCQMYLQELNPDVHGDYIEHNIEDVLENGTDYLKVFNVIIGTALPEKTAILLSEKCWEMDIPLFVIRSVGFIGSARVQLKQHCVVETHPDNPQYDLRIEEPFPELKEHLDSITITPKVPWVVIVYKYLQQWREKTGEKVPSTYKQKCELKKLIREGMTSDEENFEEAIKAVNSCFGSGRPTATNLKLFEDVGCNSITIHSDPFWYILRAVKDFMEEDGGGLLPVGGVVPDMTADTESFISLQKVYHTKAKEDMVNVFKRAQNNLTALKQNPFLINEKMVTIFCREMPNVWVYRGSKISDEYEPYYRGTNINQGLEAENSLMEFYVGLRVMDKFKMEHGCVPGEINVESDTARMKVLAQKLLADWNIATPLSDDLLHEISRYGGAEIHTVSAFIGGCVAHEVIKVITNQYKPIKNTLVYNAITGQTAVFEL